MSSYELPIGALCPVCGKPWKLIDMREAASAVGRRLTDERLRFRFECCVIPTINDNREFHEIIGILKRYYQIEE